MKEYILKTFNVDEEKLDLLTSKSRQIDLVKARWEMWESLSKAKYPIKEISKFFNRPTGVIKHGIARLEEDKGKVQLPKLTAIVVYDITGIKYMADFKKTRNKKITRERWKVYEALREAGYSSNNIAEYFGNSAFVINYGLRKIKGPEIDKSLPKITGKVITRAGKVDKDELYETLRHFGHSNEQIARYFNISVGKVRYGLTRAKKARELKQLNNKRKSFVKF